MGAAVPKRSDRAGPIFELRSRGCTGGSFLLSRSTQSGPGGASLKVSRLGVSTGRSLRLARADLEALGVEMSRYGERDYARTQEIGGVAASLGIDGLIAPSARWPCDNLMIFTNNHHAGERLEVVGSEEVEWRAWARSHGFLGA
ncbi:MAG: RES family NAD+ phosphorylase [Roseiarcus sp.]